MSAKEEIEQPAIDGNDDEKEHPSDLIGRVQIAGNDEQTHQHAEGGKQLKPHPIRLGIDSNEDKEPDLDGNQEERDKETARKKL